MPVKMSDKDFEYLVGEALDDIPSELTDQMSNVVILVEPRHEDDPHILGLYHGIALTERTSEYGGFLPDTITIYREPILAICTTAEQVKHEVKVTVVHEVAHHFGISDAWLHANGWG
ncbi:hypothetical protein GOEFS_015_00450 [Gordonia effusa NBRC 100432]|uniref:Metallopeptidase family protein n=1 Tax=Gordonia effusa NBRC 100432 TaxID=1077974 RepID=H0QVH1_9ACTN|nr:metallopeptidase family protein [Gordonia effusa]GAB16848.1 hypothetical protein GOEFS_015_00450 [Gordonia effusa NBRC 100432]